MLLSFLDFEGRGEGKSIFTYTSNTIPRGTTWELYVYWVAQSTYTCSQRLKVRPTEFELAFLVGLGWILG